jgi:GNAT superfamily N-acetyltransferase
MSVELALRPAGPDDAAFVHECLTALRGRAQYDVQRLREYLELLLDEQGVTTTILVASNAGTAVGLLTVNRFAMPRYLGFGIELEEVVVHAEHRRKGYGTAMINSFLRSVQDDGSLRSVRVRTDDHEGSGRLYARMFNTTQIRLYATSVHPL